MNAQDVEIMKSIRRELAKHPIDITRLDIQVNMGRVSLGGMVTNTRDQPTVNLRDELTMIDKRLSKDRLIREYSNMVRLIQFDEHAHDDTNTRGRMRHG